MPRLRAGVADIAESFRRPGLWLIPGWYDFLLPYRRTVIGPFWETLVMAVWTAGLGVVFSRVINYDSEAYYAYLATSMFLWFYMSWIISSGTALFESKRIFLMSVNNPIYTYPLRHMVAGAGRLAMHAPVLAVVLLLDQAPGPPRPLTAALGLAAVLLASLWVVPVLGILGARYHDLKYVLQMGMRFLFFVTPVFWRIGDLSGTRTIVARANPFTSFLDVVRAPLLGEPVDPISWPVVLVVNAAGMVLAVLLHARCHRRIAFWM